MRARISPWLSFPSPSSLNHQHPPYSILHTSLSDSFVVQTMTATATSAAAAAIPMDTSVLTLVDVDVFLTSPNSPEALLECKKVT